MCGPISSIGLVNPYPKKVTPHTVDHRLGDLGLLASSHQFGQLCSAVDCWTGIDFLVEELRIGDPHQAAPLFVVNRSREIAEDQFRIVVNHPFADWIVAAVIDSADLAKEAVKLPKSILLPVVEGMAMALCALNLNAQKQPSCFGGRLDYVVVTVRDCCR